MALSRVVSLESLVSKMTYNVLMWTLNPTNSLTRVVSEILNVENVVTLKTGLGVRQVHWKYHHSIERIEFLLTFLVIIALSFLSALEALCDYALYKSTFTLHYITFTLSCVLSEKLNVQHCRDLEIGVRGHSRSLKVVPLDRLYTVSY